MCAVFHSFFTHSTLALNLRLFDAIFLTCAVVKHGIVCLYFSSWMFKGESPVIVQKLVDETLQQTDESFLVQYSPINSSIPIWETGTKALHLHSQSHKRKHLAKIAKCLDMAEVLTFLRIQNVWRITNSFCSSCSTGIHMTEQWPFQQLQKLHKLISSR